MLEFLAETLPLGTLRRQARADLAPPTTSFSGKTVMLIAPTGVICSEATRILASLGAESFVFGVRSMDKGNALADEISNEFGTKRENILVWELQLSSFASVEDFATKANALPRIDVVVLGASVMILERVITGDGWEETLQVIHLSTALLVTLVLPKLLESAVRHENKTILLNVSSVVPRLQARQLQGLGAKTDIPLLRVVDNPEILSTHQGICKSVSFYWIRSLADLFNPGQVEIHSLDPGATNSPLTSQVLPARIYVYFFGRSAEMCGRTVVNSCLPVEGGHGAFFVDYDREPYPNFMETPPFKAIREKIWKETREVLENVSPGARKFFLDLDDGLYSQKS